MFILLNNNSFNSFVSHLCPTTSAVYKPLTFILPSFLFLLFFSHCCFIIVSSFFNQLFQVITDTLVSQHNHFPYISFASPPIQIQGSNNKKFTFPLSTSKIFPELLVSLIPPDFSSFKLELER